MNRAQQPQTKRRATRGVTLIELLVVISTIALLTGLLVPGLTRAREQAKAALCASNLREAASANSMYAQDSGGMFAPGAIEIATRNLHRWHGTRKKINEDFDPGQGPLAGFLGVDRGIRACPTFVPDKPGFEKGNGGYGYNNAYIGVQTLVDSKGRASVMTDQSGVRTHHVLHPADTVMFADAAFMDSALIEYSFAEPRFHPQYQSRTDPSIHFRHDKSANVAWCDGHVAAERMTFSQSSGFYEGDPARHYIGWFGSADDNSAFDLK